MGEVDWKRGSTLLFLDFFIILIVVVGIVFVGLYYFSKWSQKKMVEQQKMITATSQQLTIYVIDKKRDKVKNTNLPKAVMEQMPKRANLMKMHFVKAKVGPQIMTLISDKAVWNALPLKKNVKVDVSGIYITSMKGMKSKEEMKALTKEKKKIAKEAKA